MVDINWAVTTTLCKPTKFGLITMEKVLSGKKGFRNVPLVRIIDDKETVRTRVMGTPV